MQNLSPLFLQNKKEAIILLNNVHIKNVEKYTHHSKLNKSITEILNELTIAMIDQSLYYSDDRINIVSKIIEDQLENKDSSLRLFIESEKYKNKFGNKTSKSMLSESDYWSIGLELIIDFLLFPKFKNKQHEESWDILNGEVFNNYFESNHQIYDDNKKVLLDNYFKKTDGYPLLSKNAKKKLFNHISLDKLREDENKDELSEEKVKALELEKQFNKKIKNQIEISQDDIEKYPEVGQILDGANYLKTKLGHGKNDATKELNRIKINEELKMKVNRYGNQNTLSYIQTISEIQKNTKKDIFTERELVFTCAAQLNIDRSGVFSLVLPQNIKTDPRQYSNYNIVGIPIKYTERKYYNDIKKLYSDLVYEAKYVRERLRSPFSFNNTSNSTITDYDYSMFSFGNEQHVYALLKLYKQLEDTNVEDVSSLIDELNDYIEQCEWNRKELDIIHMFKSGFSVRKIVLILENEYELEHKKARREIKNIAKKICSLYMQLRDEFIMDKYKIKGKKCSKCGIIKLSCKRNFSPDARNSDRLRGICKKCDSYTKKREKT